MLWHDVKKEFPEYGRRFLVARNSGGRVYFYNTASFSKDLYKVDDISFVGYENEKHAGFYNYDADSDRYYEIDNVLYWAEIEPAPTDEKQLKILSAIKTIFIVSTHTPVETEFGITNTYSVYKFCSIKLASMFCGRGPARDIYGNKVCLDFDEVVDDIRSEIEYKLL